MRLRHFALHASTDGAPSSDGVAQRFAQSTRCVTALFERHFPKFLGSRVWKVVVECGPPAREPRINEVLGVLTVQQRLDLQGYLAAEPARQKRLAFDALWAGIVEIASHEGWSLEPFEEARRAALQRDLVNTWNWPGRAVRQRGTRRWAVLRCEHDTDAFRAAFLVRDRAGNELLHRPAFEEVPVDSMFLTRLGSLAWTAPDRLALRAGDGSLVAEADVPASRPAAP